MNRLRSPKAPRDPDPGAIRRLLIELAVAGSALALLFGGLAAYAGMWPPVLVVESGSMQHSDTTSELGILDTGDLAVIQSAHSTADIVTYVRGRAAGYSSFGDYGDVIAFVDPEPNESAVLLHRAFAYVVRNASGGFDVPELALIPRSDWWGVSTSGSNASGPNNLRAFSVAGMGWRHDLTMTWDLVSLGTNDSNNGFLTFGDHNLYRTSRRTDPWILPASYIVARARGEIPWLGLLRLTLVRSPEGCCTSWGSTDPDFGAPGNSWTALEAVLVLAFATPIGLDFVLRRHPAQLIRRIFGTGSKTGDDAPEGEEVGAATSEERKAGSKSSAEGFEAWLGGIDDRIARLRSPGDDDTVKKSM